MRILQPFRKSTTKKSEFQKNNTSETFVKNNTTWCDAAYIVEHKVFIFI